MSNKGLKGFYDDTSWCYFVVFDSAPVLPYTDEGSGSSTYESPPSTYSDEPRKNKAKRVRFLHDLVVTGFRYKFAYPPLHDNGVKWNDRGWTPTYMVRLWQEWIRESSDPKYVKERNFWIFLVQDWGSHSV